MTINHKKVKFSLIIIQIINFDSFLVMKNHNFLSCIFQNVNLMFNLII